MESVKLDAYDYRVYSGIIEIQLCGTNDPDLVDIMSEIELAGGRIYLDGVRHRYQHYKIVGRGKGARLELYVRKL